eukprot:1161901-Pelagomonas_calceolata.AAC.2
MPAHMRYIAGKQWCLSLSKLLQVTITQQGDSAGDLLIIADGVVSVAPPSSAATDLHGSAPSMGGHSMGNFEASEHGSMCLDVSTKLPAMDITSDNLTSSKKRDSVMSVDNASANPASVKDQDSAMSVNNLLSKPTSTKNRDSAMSVDKLSTNPTFVKQRDSAMSASSFKMTRFGGKLRASVVMLEPLERNQCGAALLICW